MTIEKINFAYPKGSLQSVFDTEEMTALELAAKTSKKVDEVVDLANGIEQVAIEATAIVDEMRNTQATIVTELSEIVIPAATESYVDEKITDGTIGDMIDTQLVAPYSARLGTAETDIATLQTASTSHGNSITTLGDRMTTAEGEIDNLQTASTSHGNSITTLGDRMTTAEGEIDNLQTASTSHGNSITTLGDRMTTAEGDIDNLQTASTSHGSNIVALTERVDTVEDNISTINTTIAANGLNATKEINTSVVYASAIDDMKKIPSNAFKQSKKSINENGTLKIACIGTSISEGGDLANNGDAYFPKLVNKITAILAPLGITPASQSFALGGRQITHASSTTYVAVNPEPADITLGFWRSWSTVGKTWRDHVKDYAPDLIFFEFGINDALALVAEKVFSEALDSFVLYTKTWTKAPDIVLINTILPTTNGAYYTQSQNITNAVARVAREYGKQKGYAVADVNRLWQIMRDGKDEVERVTNTEQNFATYPEGWYFTHGGSSAEWTFANSTLTPVNGLIGRFVGRAQYDFYNGKISVDVKPAGGAVWISYRVKDGRKNVCLISPGAGNASIVLYSMTDSTVAIGTVTNLNIPTGATNNIRIEAEGIRHRVYLNNTLVLDVSSYLVLHDGSIEIGSDGQLPTFSNLTISKYNPITFNPPFTELDLLGAYNDPSTDGNAINHPTPLGHALAYLPACNFVQDLANTKESGVQVNRKILPASWVAAAAPYPVTSDAGEKIWYYVLANSHYNRKRGLIVQRQDTYVPYTLSEIAYTQSTMHLLEPGKCALQWDGTNDLIFVSVPAGGSVTWDMVLSMYV